MLRCIKTIPTVSLILTVSKRNCILSPTLSAKSLLFKMICLYYKFLTTGFKTMIIPFEKSANGTGTIRYMV